MGFEIYGFWEVLGMSLMGAVFLLVPYRVFLPGKQIA
jgi:hypothetical protein